MKENNSVLKIAGNLMLACLLSGCVIGAVYFVTEPVAEKTAQQMKEDSLHELVPDADAFCSVPARPDWQMAMRKGNIEAYIVPVEGKGYGGRLSLLVAVDRGGRVIDYKVLAHNETPGLGDQTTKPPFRQQFQGKSVNELIVSKEVSLKETHIQAITGATISSRGITQAVQEAVKLVDAFEGGH